jgi:hypothetical protein
MARRPVDLMAAVEHEIRGEKASGLGRMGERVEQLLAELRRRGATVAATPHDERAARVAAFNDCRGRAEEALYWLCVQREAMGLRNHEAVLAIFPIPPKLR